MKCNREPQIARLVAVIGALVFCVPGLVACGKDSPPKALVFPDGFQWGVASSAHESEGNNVNSDWQSFEDIDACPPAGLAQNSYAFFEKDNENAAALGLNTVQLTIEWARIVPKKPADLGAPLTADDIDEKEVAHYHEVIDSLVAKGITPVVAVTHFSLPRWVSDAAEYDAEANEFTGSLGGWTNNDTAKALAQYATFSATEYGDHVKWWITTDEPVVVLLAGYMTGNFPPGIDNLTLTEPEGPGGTSSVDVLKNMIDGHARAYHAIKAVDPTAKVTFAQNMVAWDPKDPENADDVAATKRVDYMYNLLFLDAVTKGTFDTSLVGDGPFEKHPDWKDTLDVMGVNFYDHNIVIAANGVFAPLNAVPCAPALADAMPDLFDALGCPQVGPSEPEGLIKVLLANQKRYGLPQLITENGFIDTPDGKARRTVEILAALHSAIEQGADVIGYHYWTLNYDYEWNNGWEENMGIFTIAGFGDGSFTSEDGGVGAPGPDTDFTRVPLQPMFDVYRDIATSNTLPSKWLAKYLH